jgi:hypothetical protein
MNRETTVEVLDDLISTGSIAGVCDRRGVSWEYVTAAIRHAVTALEQSTVVTIPTPSGIRAMQAAQELYLANNPPLQTTTTVAPQVEPETEPVRPRREKRNRA